MNNVLFYGNCQICALQMILNLNINEYNIIVIECYNTNITKIELDNVLKNIDIVIMQTTVDNYRNKEYLSSNYLINNSNNTCKIIFFDNCYFNFYYFDTTIHPKFSKDENKENNDFLWEPSLNHYSSFLQCYNNDNSNSKDFYIKNYINNYFLKDENELNKIAEDGINELVKRKNNMLNYKNLFPIKNIDCISIAEFIRENYKKQLLFYTYNHPCKIVLQFIANEILNILNIPNTIDYNIDPLNYEKCILYKCINRGVHFDTNNCKPLLNNECNIENIIDLYSNVYKSIPK